MFNVVDWLRPEKEPSTREFVLLVIVGVGLVIWAIVRDEVIGVIAGLAYAYGMARVVAHTIWLRGEVKVLRDWEASEERRLQDVLTIQREMAELEEQVARIRNGGSE